MRKGRKQTASRGGTITSSSIFLLGLSHPTPKKAPTMPRKCLLQPVQSRMKPHIDIGVPGRAWPVGLVAQEGDCEVDPVVIGPPGGCLWGPIRACVQAVPLCPAQGQAQGDAEQRSARPHILLRDTS